MCKIAFMISAFAALLLPSEAVCEEIYCQQQWYAHCDQKRCETRAAASGDTFIINIEGKTLKRCMILLGELDCWQLPISDISANPFLRQISVTNGSALSDQIVITTIESKTTFFATLLNKDGSTAASGLCAVNR